MSDIIERAEAFCARSITQVAQTLIPDLIAEVKAVRAERDEAIASVNDWADKWADARDEVDYLKWLAHVYRSGERP